MLGVEDEAEQEIWVSFTDRDGRETRLLGLQRTWTTGQWHMWELIMRMYWVCVCVCCLYLLSSSLYPAHQLVSTLMLFFQVQLQLLNPVLQSEAATSTRSLSVAMRVCFLSLTGLVFVLDGLLMCLPVSILSNIHYKILCNYLTNYIISQWL